MKGETEDRQGLLGFSLQVCSTRRTVECGHIQLEAGVKYTPHFRCGRRSILNAGPTAKGILMYWALFSLHRQFAWTRSHIGAQANLSGVCREAEEGTATLT